MSFTHTDVTKDAEATLGNNEETVPYKIVHETTPPRTYYYPVVHNEGGETVKSEIYGAAATGGGRWWVRCAYCNSNIASASKGYESLEDAQHWLETVIVDDAMHFTCEARPL